MFVIKERVTDTVYGSIARWFINTIISPEYLRLKWLAKDEEEKFLIFFKRAVKKPYAVWEVKPEKINDELYNNYYNLSGDNREIKVIKTKEIFFDLLESFNIALMPQKDNNNALASMNTKGTLTLFDKEIPSLTSNEKKINTIINSEQYKKFPNKIFTEEYKQQIYITLAHELGHYLNVARTMNMQNTNRISNRWKGKYAKIAVDAEKDPQSPEKVRKNKISYAIQPEEIQARIAAASTFIVNALNKQNTEDLSQYEREILLSLALRKPENFISSLINSPININFDLDTPYIPGWQQDPRLVKAINLTKSRIYGLYSDLLQTRWGILTKLRAEIGASANLSDREKSLEAQRLLAARRARILKRKKLGIST